MKLPLPTYSRYFVERHRVVAVCRCLLILTSIALVNACGESKRELQSKLDRDRTLQAEALKAKVISRYPDATQFDYRDPQSLSIKLTIDAQDSIAAAPAQLYWNEVSAFDIYRNRNGLNLTFRGRGDRWISLECADELASRIRQERNPHNIYCRYLLIFKLSSVAPLKVQLSAESDGSGEDTTLSVSVDDINGLIYKGQLIDFSILDSGHPLR